MVDLSFEKVYATDRKNENCYIGIPFKKGALGSVDTVSVTDTEGKETASQSRATAFWDDGSVKWLFTRFEADIPANRGAEYVLHTDRAPSDFEGIVCENGIVDTGCMRVKTVTGERLFDYIELNGRKYENLVSMPVLKDKKGNEYTARTDEWECIEAGKLTTVLKAGGNFCLGDKKVYACELKLTFHRNKSAFELGCRVINTTDEALDIQSLVITSKNTGEGRLRNATGISNYKTKLSQSDGGELFTYVDAEYLKYESNEHNPEVYYGTFFGDITDGEIGITGCVYQAQQNFPKAVRTKGDTMEIMLVPEGIGSVTMEHGMAREQRVLYYFHTPDEDIQSINNRTIIYQMPDKPAVSPSVFREAKVFTDVFADGYNYDVEFFIMTKADDHARAYGMMSWGDCPDMGYTEQGRGGKNLVWANNEYDYPHACALQYVRTGTRRFLDYVIVNAEHWMDVDVCHYSKDPLIMGGQYEHTWRHIMGNNVVCSHQWAEGLLDYYHFTGNKEALDTAIGIGENIERILETPLFSNVGEANARETGWALRTLTALYVETNDERWLKKCDRIVGHFEQWEQKYGLWLAQYTDNSVIRVVFMIAVAVGSLMRYYRVRPQQKIKDMILRAVKDLCDNARLENGLFYYKELPSLKRLGNNPLILEALTIAYELSGDEEYIKAGIPTLKYVMSYKAGGPSFKKTIAENSLIQGSASTKSFAQLMIPVTVFYVTADRLGLL